MEIENLIRLIETVSASELTGLKYEENGVKLHLTKKKGQVQVVAAPEISTGMEGAVAAIAAEAPVVTADSAPSGGSLWSLR